MCVWNFINHTVCQDPWLDGLMKKLQTNPKSLPGYKVIDGKVYRYSKAKYTLSGEFDWKEVVPEFRRTEIIADNHTEPTAAHMGMFKTHRRVSLRYFWPGMYKDIKKYVKSCDTCAAYKVSNENTPGEMGKPKICHRPFQVLSIDLVGPLPRSRAGYTYLLVLTCCFSKYTMLFPLRKATSAAVAKSVETGVLLIHGVPETVIADNGGQFTGAEFQTLLRRYKVPNVHYTPRYTPQVNLVERYNKTVMTAVSAYVKDDHRSWDTNLAKIQFAINSAVNESTKFSPFFLVHGREPVIDGSFYTATDSEYEPGVPREEYAGEFEHLKVIFEKVHEHILKAHNANAKHYNLRRRKATFAVGDTIWKRSYPLSDAAKFKAAKLCPKYEKGIVTKVRSPLVYELENAKGKALGAWHIKDLKK